jgi:hypothetical protein
MTSLLPSLCRGWRAGLVLAAVACAAPARATAGCGDHVVILTQGAPGADARESFAPAGTDHALPQKPCSGPNCSRAPERQAPPSAPAPNSGPDGKESLQVQGAVESPDGASSPRCDSRSAVPVRRATSIFHPPRAG